jgi:hypothetical protein
MSKRKRQSKKKLCGKSRLNDAKKWLINHPQKDLLNAYSKRYCVNQMTADEELTTLGYYDELFIQHYEKEGIEWEYKVEPLSGDMVVVPKETEEHEIYEIHGLF